MALTNEDVKKILEGLEKLNETIDRSFEKSKEEIGAAFDNAIESIKINNIV